MKILVTGANGFLGQNILRYMTDAHSVMDIVAADLDQSLGVPSGRIEYRHFDVRDGSACHALVEAVRPTHVIHAAAVTLTDESSACSRDLTTAVNFGGAQNILDAAVTAGSVERLVMLSSSGVYAQTDDSLPCDEEHALDLSIGYARAKRDAEMLMAQYEARSGFPIVAARVGPIYGEFERARASRPKVSMIQELADFLVEKHTVRIAGTNSYRDWTHARDVAKALDGLLLTPILSGRLYNVSAGVSISARLILDIFSSYGLKVEWVDNVDSADIILGPQQNRKPLVIDRLRNDTRFVPHFDIKSGIAQMLEAAEHV